MLGFAQTAVRRCSIFTCVFVETNCQRRSEDFLFKEIFLVEEEDDGGVAEPFVVADGVEQLETLLHSVLKYLKLLFDAIKNY